jgi:hypothetical protein
MANVSSTSLTTLSLAGTPTVRLSSFTGGEGEQLTQARTGTTQFTALHANALAGKTRTFLPKGGTGQDNLLLLGVS